MMEPENEEEREFLAMASLFHADARVRLRGFHKMLHESNEGVFVPAFEAFEMLIPAFPNEAFAEDFLLRKLKADEITWAHKGLHAEVRWINKNSDEWEAFNLKKGFEIPELIERANQRECFWYTTDEISNGSLLAFRDTHPSHALTVVRGEFDLRVTYWDIQVSALDISAFLAKPPPAEKASDGMANKVVSLATERAGRKAHGQTDELWAEMLRLVYEGKWTDGTTRRSQAVREMREFLERKSEESGQKRMSDDSIEDKVRLAWKALGFR